MGCGCSGNKAAAAWRYRNKPGEDEVKSIEPRKSLARRKSIEEIVSEQTAARMSFLRNIALNEADDTCLELDEVVNTGDVTKCYKFTDTILSRRTRVMVRMVIDRQTDHVRVCRQCSTQKHGDMGALGLKPKQMKQQSTIAYNLSHPNILEMHDIFLSTTDIYEIVEYCSGGRLFESIIDGHRHTERETANFMNQLLQAVDYLHNKMICHRDIKPEHILFKDRELLKFAQIKLIDFTSASYLGPGEPMTRRVTTPFYASPQVFQERYTDALDMWSCGVVMHLCLLGYPRRTKALQKKLVGAELLAYVTKGRFRKQEETDVYLSEGSLVLLDNLLKTKESDRISAPAAVLDEWLKFQSPQPNLALSIKSEEPLNWTPGEATDRGGMLY